MKYRFQVLIDYLDGSHDSVMTEYSPKYELTAVDSTLKIWDSSEWYCYPLCNIRRYCIKDVVG